MLTGSVLITGGAGFLGRAILRRAEREKWPATFTVYSRDEEKQFKVKQRWPGTRCILGDIRSLDRLIVAMQGHDTVIHASAVKFVPEAEYNVSETIEVNTQGSMNVAVAARAAGVKTVIGVSTDKACMPVNLYGATKMVMERLFGEADNWGETRFIVTRYGNVIGSTGSIVPVFRKQLEQHGRVKVTDPAMTRFWLTPDEAVDLIITCSGYAGILRGKILVPMPSAMSIGALARVIAGEAPVETIGPRPGEKKHESLVSFYEAPRTFEDSFDLGRTPRLIITPSTAPAYEGASNVNCPLMAQSGYSSMHPRHWIEPAEMYAKIKDAESV